jgi:hypothetical protein
MIAIPAARLVLVAQTAAVALLLTALAGPAGAAPSGTLTRPVVPVAAGIAAPSNLTLHTASADCKSAQFGATALSAHSDLESLCEYELKTNQDALVTWTWSKAPCGQNVCRDASAFVPFDGSPFFAPFKSDARAALFYLSDLKNHRCFTLRTAAGDLTDPTYSVDSNRVCLPLQLTRPMIFATPRPH